MKTLLMPRAAAKSLRDESLGFSLRRRTHEIIMYRTLVLLYANMQKADCSPTPVKAIVPLSGDVIHQGSSIRYRSTGLQVYKVYFT